MVKCNKTLLNIKKVLRLYQELYNINIPLVIIVLFAIAFSIVNGILFLPIYCHPNPLSYEPQPNQIIDLIQTPPDKVAITFTERPELKASSIRVMNLNNERIDNHDLKIAGSDKSLSVSLNKSKLISGDYTIKWLVLSKDDGFITKGSYIFSIGRTKS
ncbi:copper resistance CopC family protein [Candidatus Nitrosocosmicus sp. R]